MATRAYSIKRRNASSNGGKDVIVTWAGLANGDRGQWYSDYGMVLRAFGLRGTLGAGGTVQLRGSMIDYSDATNNDQLAASDENLITGASMNAITAVVSGQYTAVPSYAPVVTAGDGTTNLTCTAYFIAD